MMQGREVLSVARGSQRRTGITTASPREGLGHRDAGDHDRGGREELEESESPGVWVSWRRSSWSRGKLETKLSNLSLATYCADFRDGVASEPQPRRLTRGSISTTASARRQIPRAPQAPQGTRRAEVCVNWDTHIVISFHAHMTLTSMRLMPADRRIALERGGASSSSPSAIVLCVAPMPMCCLPDARKSRHASPCPGPPSRQLPMSRAWGAPP